MLTRSLKREVYPKNKREQIKLRVEDEKRLMDEVENVLNEDWNEEERDRTTPSAMRKRA